MKKTGQWNAKSGPKVVGKLLCEKNLRDVWCRNESVRAEIGQILHTHAAKLVVEIRWDALLPKEWS